MYRIQKIVDLSHPLVSGMPVFPGDDAPQFRGIEDVGFRDMVMTFGSHIGTHVDVPAHVINDGATLDEMPLNSFLGTACCLDFSFLPRSNIEPADLNPFHHLINNSEFILLQTGWSRFWGSDQYFHHYPFLSQEAANWLLTFPLKGIGIDAPSLEGPDDSALPVHRVLLEQKICLVENLTSLGGLPGDGFLFLCLPLKLSKGNGSPVRAAAIFLG